MNLALLKDGDRIQCSYGEVYVVVNARQQIIRKAFKTYQFIALAEWLLKCKFAHDVQDFWWNCP